MCNSWEKVRSFLQTMNIQDLHSALPSSISSFSHSSSSSKSLQPLSIDSRRWQVGEMAVQQILSVIEPNEDSEDSRKEIIAYLQTLIEDTYGVKVFSFGSVPLKTYLPHGDIDLTVLNHYIYCEDLATEICSLLEFEEKFNTDVQVKDVLCIPAQVRVVKCTVGGISIDISFNQKAGLCALNFLEQAGQFIGKDCLFERSVILIKAWCFYESRILGGFHGLISTYALEIMVLHVLNSFHSSLQCPLAVLYKFLEYFSTFDWNNYGVAINGLVVLSTLPEIVVQPPLGSDDLLLTDTYIKRTREEVLSSMGVVGSNTASFSVKFLNILDPLRDDNNLGRSVSKGNFFRIRSALSFGAGKLGSIMMLPLENIMDGLQVFFKNTLERNGESRWADSAFPVSTYGSETSCESSGSDFISGVTCDLWLNDSVMYSATPQAPEDCQVWNNGWTRMDYYAPFNMYNNFYQSPYSFDGLTSFATSNASLVQEKPKSKGIGTFFPNLHLLQQMNREWERNEVKHENGKEHEVSEEYKTERKLDIAASLVCTHREVNSSPDETESTESLSFSIEEFPVLPGSKPIPVTVRTLWGCPEPTVVEELSTSLDYSLEQDSFKHSLPRSLLSKVSEQPVSDVSIIFDLVSDPTTVIVPEDEVVYKSEEKLVVPEQPLQLADDLEFPSLSRPPKPVIILNKKEFPTLHSSLKTRRRPKWRKDSK